jgi:hypothetical protein
MPGGCQCRYPWLPGGSLEGGAAQESEDLIRRPDPKT